MRGYRRGDKNRISIHALRVEGDLFIRIDAGIISRFLSTPSGWRATKQIADELAAAEISIHALRVEGDQLPSNHRYTGRYFYPRPPGGGRRNIDDFRRKFYKFLSTPSGWRATCTLRMIRTRPRRISIHALRVEGDIATHLKVYAVLNFYPRPPGGGRPPKRAKLSAIAYDFYPRPPGGGRRSWFITPFL